MCGIVSAISKHNIMLDILDGIIKLEYRGYDSTGVGFIADQQIKRQVELNGANELKKTCAHQSTSTAIGHTRWATHGIANIANAHPQLSHNQLAIVHNGIVENYKQHYHNLIKLGYTFTSDTDTEVIAHFMHYHYSQCQNMKQVLLTVMQQLNGVYSIVLLNMASPNTLYAIQSGTPLIIGIKEDSVFVVSDTIALPPNHTMNIVCLEDNEAALIDCNQILYFNKKGESITKQSVYKNFNSKSSDLQHYEYYMEKEIFEQENTVNNLIENINIDVLKNLQKFNRIICIACGSSYNAIHTASYWFEEISDKACVVYYASEFMYQKISITDNDLFICISQSGETIDTINCFKKLEQHKITNILVISNVEDSTLYKLAKEKILLHAGIEISVASTKAFTHQLIVLLYIAISYSNKTIQTQFLLQIAKLMDNIHSVLDISKTISKVSHSLHTANNIILVGRNSMFPICMEGSLKIKEVAYIHTEAYAAGELKHGPLALIDEDTPVILLMPKTILYDKMLNTLQEIKARNGTAYIITDDISLADAENVIILPQVELYFTPIIYAISLQLVAYYIGLHKKLDIDRPRNLAKSVTVE